MYPLQGPNKMSRMAHSDFFSGISRSLYYATIAEIGTEERVNVERILRKFQSCMYTDVLQDNSCYVPGNADHREQFSIIMHEIHRTVHSQLWGSIYDVLKNSLNFLKFNELIVSGSRAEGFDFETSDYDVMLVIDKIGEREFKFHVEEDPDYPGFVRLKILSDMGEALKKTSFYDQDGSYFSSYLFKAYLENLFTLAKFAIKLHGPCLSLILNGLEDHDNDFALVCKQDTWPTLAKECINRLVIRGWPSEEVLKDILKGGCLFVPIGFPLTCVPPEQAERLKMQWRMSFSVAENMLIHSMNHTQFLTYGLLKLTLKEICDADSYIKDRGLLCSYFLKTAVFWEIVSSSGSWDPSNLLHRFWGCFRRILRWVDAGYCPNFFVPENNMFRAKIHGDDRRKVLESLVKWYRDGYKILLEIIPHIDLSGKTLTAYQTDVPVWYDKSKNLIHLVRLLKYNELHQMGSKVAHEKKKLATKEQCEYSIAMHILFQLTDVNEACLKMLSSSIESNNRKYSTEKKLMKLLTLSSPYCARGYIYLAYQLYMRKRYENSIRLLHKALSKLKDPNTVYRWEFFDGQRWKYSSRTFVEYRMIGGSLLPIPYMMRRHVASEICMNFQKCLLDLTGERNEKINVFKQAISPILFSHFLMFLCHFRRGSLFEAGRSLRNLERSLPIKDVTKDSFSENTWKLSDQIFSIAKRLYNQ